MNILKTDIFKKALALLCLSVLPLSILVSQEPGGPGGPGTMSSSKEYLFDGPRLQFRGTLVPFHSRQAALSGSESDYILDPESWTRRQYGESVGWKTRIKIPNSFNERRTILRTEGAASSFSVEVNGRQAGYSQYGIGNIEFDITEYLEPYYNTVEILIYGGSVTEAIENHRSHEELRFRRAYFISQPQVRIGDIIPDAAVSVDGNGMFSLAVATQSNLRNPAVHTLSYELLSPEGKTVASGSRELTTAWMSDDTLRFAAAIPYILPWSHETPNLYTLLVSNHTAGRDVEYIASKVGFRTVSYSNGTLIVNGFPVTFLAHTAGYTGEDAGTEEMLRQLKRTGANCVVVPGYPQPASFYEICDRLGLYVCDAADIDTSGGPQQITVGGNPSNDPSWTEIYTERALAMYRASRSHPSVIAFSPAWKAGNGFCLYESYLMMKSLEKERPVVYRDSGGQWNDDGIVFDGNPTGHTTINRVDIGGYTQNGDYHYVVRNLYELTPLKGYVTYVVKQGARIKSIGTEPIDISPGKEHRATVSTEKLATAKDKRSVDVYVFLPIPAYERDPINTMSVVAPKEITSIAEVRGMEPVAQCTVTEL